MVTPRRGLAFAAWTRRGTGAAAAIVLSRKPRRCNTLIVSAIILRYDPSRQIGPAAKKLEARIAPQHADGGIGGIRVYSAFGNDSDRYVRAQGHAGSRIED